MKFRHKITTMVSAAAALVVIVAVAALAAGGLNLGAPKQDIVLGQQHSAAPVADAQEIIVYSHRNGTYYHAQASCSGMKNAPETTLTQAEADGKKPCPACIPEDIVYSTENGSFYHVLPDCSGMKNAYILTVDEAESSGKPPCPVCIEAAFLPTPMPVRSTPEPTLPVTATLTPRPTPMPRLTAQNEEHSGYSIGIIGGADGPTSIFITHPTLEPEAFAYTTENTDYYHMAENCPGAQDCARTSVEEAQARGKKPCPVCVPPSTATPTPAFPTPVPANPKEEQRQEHWLDGMLQVYASQNGNFYHAIPDCSGMENAAVLLSYRCTEQGQEACPLCIPDPRDSSFRRFFGTGIDEAFPGFTRTVATLGSYSDRHGAYLNYFAHTRLENASGDSIVIQLTPPTSGLDGELELSAVGSIDLQSLLDHSYEPFGDLTNELIPLYMQKRTGSAKSCPVSAISVSFDEDENVTGCSTVLDIDEESCYLVRWPMKDGRFVLPEIEPTPMPEEKVFASEHGVYYHSDSSCAGIKGAAEMLRSEAVQMGKQACPLCMENSAQSTPLPFVQEDERVLSTPMPADSAVPGENPTFTPLHAAFSRILGLDFAEIFPGYTLDYVEGQPVEAGSNDAAYAYWGFKHPESYSYLNINLTDAAEGRNGSLNINFPDSASGFRLMKRAPEPLRSIYIKLAPDLLTGMKQLVTADARQAHQLQDVFIEFDSAMEIRAVSLFYVLNDDSTISLSWDTTTAEPRLSDIFWGE